jgi:NhaP-type Na+/H+ or K+/H+ antiporter
MCEPVPVQDVAVIAGVVLVFGVSSEALARYWITGPMFFVAAGIALGDAGLEWVEFGHGNEGVEVLAEATLVLVLFSDATRIDLKALSDGWRLPARLLGIGSPLTVIAGIGVGVVVLDLSWQEAGHLAAVLTPTDAALGAAVVTDERLPVRIRQALNVESGLNDGLAVPVVAVFTALLLSEQAEFGTGFVRESFTELGLGVLWGVALGCGGGYVLRVAAERRWAEPIWQQLSTLSIAVLAFTGADLIDGNGFVAAFTAGLAFGQIAGRHCKGIQNFTIDFGEGLAGATFAVFGAILAGPALERVSWEILLYSLLSLTLVRMIPVGISMLTSHVRPHTRMFLGWFGPRGLASIVFGLLVLETVGESSPSLELFDVVAWTVLLSIVLHGLTAQPLAKALAAELNRMEAEHPDMPELKEVTEIPVRARLAKHADTRRSTE